MAHRRRHAAHLMIFPFDELQRDPAIGDIFPDSDRRIARRSLGPGIEQRGAAGECFTAGEDHAVFQFVERFARGDSLHLSPISAYMPALRRQ